MDWVKQIRDQGAHFAIGAVAAAGMTLAGTAPASAAITVIVFGLGREIGQHDAMPWRLGRGSWLDMAFWALGGAVGSLLAS